MSARRILAAAMLLAATSAHAQYDGLNVPKPGTAEPEQEKLEAGKLSKVPKQTKFVKAEYPKEAEEKGIEADVVILLSINDKGLVDSVGIAEPSASPGMGFEEAAIIAAQGFEFEPAEMDGKPIAVQIAYKYRFVLAKKAPPPPEKKEPDAGGAATAPAAPPPPVRQPVANFTGALLERGTRLPLGGVLVTVFRDGDEGKPVGFEATSDAKGVFRFFDLPPGPWKVHVESPGYYPFRTTEEIRPNEAIDVKYFVEKGSYNPFDVTVTATRPRKEVSRTVVTAQEIEKVPGTMGDPLNIIQNFAGVARTSALMGGLIVVRGSSPEDTRIGVDGADVPIIYHFGGMRSVLPLGMIESLEFYPGNFSPYYGRAIGGYIDVQIKKLQPKKVGGYADISIMDSSLYLEAPIGKKAAIAIAGRRSYLDALILSVMPDDAPISFVTAPRYYDFQLLANYRPAPAHDIRAFVFGSDDRMKLLFKDPGQVTAELNGNSLGMTTTFYRSLLTYKFVPNDRFENTFRIAQGRNWMKMNFAQFLMDFDYYIAQIRDTVRAKITDKISVHAGLDLQYMKADAHVNMPRPPAEGEVFSEFDLSDTVEVKLKGLSSWYPGAFAELELKPLPGLLVLPGLRFDHFSWVHQNVWQPRITARWELRAGLTAKAGAGLFAQEPQINQVDSTFGNPNLKAQKAMHYSLGVEWKPRPHLTLDVTGFYKDLWSMVSNSPRMLDDGSGNLKPEVYDNRGVGQVYGLEVVARHEFANNFTGWLAYTLSRSERRDSGKTDYRLFDWDQTHILTLLGSYVLPRNWQMGGRLRLVSGRPYTPVTGASYNAYTGDYAPSYGPVNSDRIGMFAQLDVRIDKRWIYRNWILNLYLDVQNILNRANPSGYEYSYNYRQSTVRQELPIVTILGIKAEY